MISNVININPLSWYTNSKYQNHKHQYAKDRVFPLIVELGKIPVINLPIENFGSATYFKVINKNTGVENSVLLELAGLGFNVYTFTDKDYDLVQYPSILPLTTTFEEGQYYLEMSNGTDVWTSDIFTMSSSTTDCLKLEYWHNEDFVYNGGHIQYNFPFKMWTGIRTDIGKPDYKKEELVSKRAGKEFSLQITTWKEYKFEFLASEYFIDALMRVGQHDNVVVTHNGNVYNVDKFEIAPEWQKEGDIAVVVATFRTDTEVVINGRAYESIDYSAGSCGCLPTSTTTAKAVIVNGSAEHTGKYYLDTDGTTQILFVSGDWMLIDDGTDKRLHSFDGTNYVPFPDPDMPNVCIESSQEYYFPLNYFFVQTSITTAISTGVDTWDVSGNTFENIQVEIWAKDSGGIETLIITGTADDFNNNTISVNAVGAVALQARPKTLTCSNFDNSNWFLVSNVGIGWMTIGTTNIVA